MSSHHRLNQHLTQTEMLPLLPAIGKIRETDQRNRRAPSPPPGKTADGRVTSEFSERSVRHYQSKTIIDSPEKEGKEARYRYRHVLQAVLTRVMLADGFRVRMIREMLTGKTVSEYEELLEMDLMIARKMAKKIAPHRNKACGEEGSTHSAWIRLEVVPGIEVHIFRIVAPPSSKEEGREFREKICLTLPR